MANNLPTNFDRVLKANIAKYFKGAVDATLKSSVLLSKLREKGRIKFNSSPGTNMEWKARTSKRSITPTVDGQAIVVGRTSKYDTAQLGWPGYEVNDAMSEKEKIINRGDATRIINIVSGLAKELESDMKDGINTDMYLNGETADNADRIHGLETIFQISTATIPTGGSGGAVLAVGALGTDAYAGVDLSAVDSSNYYWRPSLVVDANSGQFGAGGFASGNALTIFDYACTEARKKNGNKVPDMGITSFDWYNILRTAIVAKEGIYIEGTSPKAQEYSSDLGFYHVRFNGVEVYPEQDWPTQAQGGDNGMYLLNTAKMSYEVMGKNFFNFTTQGDIESGLMTLFVLSHYGNLKFDSPCFQTKIVDQA